MKILLYGEYSGYCKSLAKGFRDNGIKSSVFSPTGDGWKNIDSEIVISGNNKLTRTLDLFKKIPMLMGFDVVLITNPTFLSLSYLGPFILLLFFIFRKKVFLLACGDDHEYIKAARAGIIKKSPFSNGYLPVERYFLRKRDRFIHHWCAMQAISIIPVMYDYHKAWVSSKYKKKVNDCVPLACYRSDKTNIKPVNYDDIVILHGINRPIIKGTDTILNALKRLTDEFDNIRILTPSNLPQMEYLKVMKNVDIAIDQCRTHSYGMNGIYSMLTGHIVVSSADKYFCGAFGLQGTPVINVVDDEQYIYEKLKSLVNSRNLEQLKRDSLDFAIAFHCPKRVSLQILNIINSQD